MTRHCASLPCKVEMLDTLRDTLESSVTFEQEYVLVYFFQRQRVLLSFQYICKEKKATLLLNPPLEVTICRACRQIGSYDRYKCAFDYFR